LVQSKAVYFVWFWIDPC